MSVTAKHNLTWTKLAATVEKIKEISLGLFIYDTIEPKLNGGPFV